MTCFVFYSPVSPLLSAGGGDDGVAVDVVDSSFGRCHYAGINFVKLISGELKEHHQREVITPSVTKTY